MKTTFLFRRSDESLDDLRKIHQLYFPGNELAVMKGPLGSVVKVAHEGEVEGIDYEEAVKLSGWTPPPLPKFRV